MWRDFPYHSFWNGEAHGQAEMMEFNYLSEHGAVKREASGKYAIDYPLMPKVIASLAKELLAMEATGDRRRAETGSRITTLCRPN